MHTICPDITKRLGEHYFAASWLKRICSRHGKKLSPAFLQGSDIYKLWENYTQIARQGIIFPHAVGNTFRRK